jgi:hypothetical protein
MRINRRQLLKALGLAGLGGGLAVRRPRARAADSTPPARVVFFVQPHGHIPNAWNMPIPGVPDDQFSERSLVDLAPEDFSEVLRPLHPFRERLLAIEGLAHTSVLADLAEIQRTGGDMNNHSVSVAQLLTVSRALQIPGAPCTGGARSLDQELALRTAAPGRFGSRVYGSDYVPNSTMAPFSFLGAGQATPIVGDPAMAFADLMGFYTPPAPTGAPPTREDLLRSMRPSVLDAVAREYELLAPQLDADGRQRLDDHRDLVRQLELGLEAPVPAACDLTFDAAGDLITRFVRLIRLAFACDLTRVVTFVAPVPQCPEFGYPADATVHATYAHGSIANNTSCGQPYSPLAERAMTDLAVWYANHFATLLQELDSVAEGAGTLLDHTVVVWLTELATPTHQHHDVCTLLAGGCNDFFRTGRYVRYPRDLANPLAGFPSTGPALNRLYTSLLQAMGQPDTSFGMTDAAGADGTPLSLTGPLTELQQ